MTLLADKNLANQLLELDEVTQIRDATGQMLGYFTPLISADRSQTPDTFNCFGLTAVELVEQFEQFRLARLASPTAVASTPQ